MISKGRKILIVEDEMVIAMDLQVCLQRQGYIVTGHATRGEEVITVINDNRPDIILMDVKLEGSIDGVETAQMIYDNYDIPVIFITSYSNKTIIDRAKKTNPFGYIVKPFDEKELFTNIELAIFKHETELKLKESEKKYRELSESIQQIIIEVDSYGIITYLNEPGMQILGVTFPELQKGISLQVFLGEMGFEKIKRRIASTDTGKPIDREHMLMNMFGKHLHVEEYLAPIYSSSKAIGYRGILIDITSKKLKETLHSLYNRITLLFNKTQIEPIEIIQFLLYDFKQHFFYIEDIYFNENSPDTDVIIRHSVDNLSSRLKGSGHSEYVIKTNEPLYLRGRELERFNEVNNLSIFGTKAICWSGFPLRFQNKSFGVFVFQSFKNENALTTGDFENLVNFFSNINAFLDRISYLKEISLSEEKYKHLVNTINEGVIQIDLYTRITFVNHQLCEIMEYTEAELLGMNLFTAFKLNPSETEFVKKSSLVKNKGFVSQYEITITSKYGKQKNLLINSSLNIGKDGSATGFIATVIDITEKVNILKHVQESEQRFKAIFDQAAVGVAIVNSKTGEILHANKKYCSIMGYSYKNLLKLNIKDSTYSDDLPLYLYNMNKLLIGEMREFSIEQRYIKKDGVLVWTNVTVSPLWKENEAPGNHISIIEDITIRKITEEGLKRSELEKENILKSIPDSFFVVSRQGKILNSYCNSNEQILKRVNYNNINGLLLDDVINQALLPQLKKDIERCFLSGKLIASDLDFKTNNQHNWFEVRYININDESVLLIMRNVTLIKSNISELQKFFNITEQTKELIMITDKEGIIEYANPAFLNVTGYDLSEIQGRNPSVLKSNKQSLNFYKEMWQTILRGESFKCRMVNAKKNGDYYVEEKIISPLFDEKGEITHFISTGKDITEDIKKERKIRIYQKFEKTLEKKEQKYRTLSLIQGQENERKRIARELHDGLGQMLTVASANLGNINIENIKKKEDRTKIEIVTQMVNEIIQESRRISYNLSPVGLYEFGLDAILKQLVSRINMNYDKVKVVYLSNLKKARFNSDIEINLYRIIQEAIQNSMKHSCAEQIDITINYQFDILKLVYKDNGKGFDIKQLHSINKHMNGIKNIEERAKIIDARIVIDSGHEKGFFLELIIKIKNIKHG